MKTWKAVAAAALAAVVVSGCMPQNVQQSADFVWPATKPHWWDGNQCWSEGRTEFCEAGAWNVLRFSRQRSGLARQVNLAGRVGHESSDVKGGKEQSMIQVGLYFDAGDVSLRCSSDSSHLRLRDWKEDRGFRNAKGLVRSRHYVWLSPDKVDTCLEGALYINVDGTEARLDTSLMQKALRKARGRS